MVTSEMVFQHKLSFFRTLKSWRTVQQKVVILKWVMKITVCKCMYGCWLHVLSLLHATTCCCQQWNPSAKLHSLYVILQTRTDHCMQRQHLFLNEILSLRMLICWLMLALSLLHATTYQIHASTHLFVVWKIACHILVAEC